MTEKAPPRQPTPEIRAKLTNLETSITYDKVTVSFAMDDRDASGRKRSCFVSLTAGKKPENAFASQEASYTEAEADYLVVSVSKKVVKATYANAILQGMIPRDKGLKESQDIEAAYDALLAKRAAKL